MFGMKLPRKMSRREEAEKPFWISFSDLMTALMVLFLVAMTVAILRVTQATITAPQKHAEAIAACMVDVEAMTKTGFPGITVSGHSISFGTLALFPKDANEFAKSLDPAARPADATLRAYVPRVLEGRALLAVVCHGALRVVRAVRLKSTGPGVRVRRVALQSENNCKCSLISHMHCCKCHM